MATKNRNWFSFIKNGRLNLEDERISLNYLKQSKWSLVFLMAGSLLAFALLMFSNYGGSMESQVLFLVIVISALSELTAQYLESKKDERLERNALNLRFFLNRLIMLGFILATLILPGVPLVFITFWLVFVQIIDHLWHSLKSGVYYEELVDRKDSLIIIRILFYVIGLLGVSFLLTLLYRPTLLNEITLWELVVPVAVLGFFEILLIISTYIKVKKNQKNN